MLALVGCGVPDSEGPLRWGDLVQVDAQVDADAAEVVDAALPDAGNHARDATPSDPKIDVSQPEPGLDAATSRGDGGDSAVPDAASSAPPDAFADAAAYASMPVATSAKQRMQKTGISPTKSACLGCHNGSSMTPGWLAGGSVFRDLDATRAARDVEVRIVDLSSARSYAAHTDVDGNFYLPKPSQPSTGPYLIGVRDGDVSRTMPLVQRGLDCNGSACHGGAQGPIHLP
jgi:hypothetical protein